MNSHRIPFGLLNAAAGFALFAAPAVGQPVPPAPPPAAPAAPRPGAPAEVLDVRDLLLPRIPRLPDNLAAGLPAQATVESLTWQRVYQLAVIRARSGERTLAETLDPKTLAEQIKKHDVADFGRFRKEFREGGTFHDPGDVYLRVLSRLEMIDNARRELGRLETLQRLFQELIQGEFPAVSQLDIDLTSEILTNARRGMSVEIGRYRDALDGLRILLGLSPHAAVIPDRREMAAFSAVWDAQEAWIRRPHRKLAELSPLAERLPHLGDVLVNGRPVPVVASLSPTGIEDVLREAATVASKNRTAGGEDLTFELKVRYRVRNLLQLRDDYAAARQSYVLAIRLMDQSFERIQRPIEGTSLPRLPEATRLPQDLIRLRNVEDRLVERWTEFRTERLALDHELGVLPYDNWDAFLASLTAPAPTPAARPARGGE